mgnify:CR=1 FL=1
MNKYIEIKKALDQKYFIINKTKIRNISDKCDYESLFQRKREKMIIIHKALKQCHKCDLYKSRTQPVTGAGNVDANALFIGEAPGANEDIKGLPFVGRAGELLTKYLNEIDLSRKDIFITNIIKCRPPGNRDPNDEEIESCFPYLKEQIKIIDPKVIVTLGRHSLATLLNRNVKITKERGIFIDYNERLLLPMLHPAAVLRNNGLDKYMREDFITLREALKNEH